MPFRNLTIRSKLLILLVIGAIGVAAIAAISLFEQRRTLIEDRKVKTQHIVESAYGVLAHFDRLVQSGKMPPDEARKAAADTLRALRYGGKEYYWIHDLDHRVIMHPTKPEFEGQIKSDLQDPHGKYVYREMVNLVKRDGEGFVGYSWPKPGSTDPVEKISYVKLYQPWGWIVGSGIYLDDVNAIFLATALRMAIALGIASVVIGGVMLSLMRGIARPIEALRTFGRTMHEVGSDGDLSRRIPVEGGDEIADVMHEFNRLMDSFQSSMRGVFSSLDHVTSASATLLHKCSAMNDASAIQSRDAASTAASVEQMTANINCIAESTREAEDVLGQARACAADGERNIHAVTGEIQRLASNVQESADTIQTLGSRSQEITGIVRVIKDIADQTNLLALNAAIEAARAGEQGRGFAVVADEVRKLAERAATATTEISTVISAIQTDTTRAVEAMRAGSATAQDGVTQVEAAAASMTRIVESTQKILSLTSEIAGAIRQQTDGGREMARYSEDIAARAATNSGVSHEALQEANALASSARVLASSVGHFKVA